MKYNQNKISILLIFFLLLANSPFAQDVNSKNEFNRLLYGLWKYENGTVSLLEDGVEKLESVKGFFVTAGFSEGEIGMKDFKYIGSNTFTCYSKCKEKRINEVRVQWLKAKVTVYDNYLVLDCIEKPTFLLLNTSIPPTKLYLVQKRKVFSPVIPHLPPSVLPPVLVLELKSNSDVIKSNSKTYITMVRSKSRYI